jgi:hypothetical protein
LTVVDLETDLINVSDKSKPHTHDCRCFENGLELDGVKLDIVIIQKKIDFINETVSDLANNSLQYSGGESADKNFAVILDEKNKEIDRQSNVIKTLQQKLVTVQKERDVLKTALSKPLSESHADNETPEINNFEEVTANDSSYDINCSVIVPNVNIVNNQQSLVRFSEIIVTLMMLLLWRLP